MPDSLQEYVDSSLAVYVQELEFERAMSLLHLHCGWGYAGTDDAAVAHEIYDSMCTEAAIEIGRIITDFDHEAVRADAVRSAMKLMDGQAPKWRERALLVSGSEYPTGD